MGVEPRDEVAWRAAAIEREEMRLVAKLFAALNSTMTRARAISQCARLHILCQLRKDARPQQRGESYLAVV